MTKKSLRSSFWTGLRVVWSALLLTACAAGPGDVAVKLQDYASLLRDLDRSEEAAIVESRAAKFRDSLKGGNQYLGFDPAATLREYAVLLRRVDRASEAEETERLAEAYSQANHAAFLRSRSERLVGDKLIVPGERIGRLMLKGNIEEVFKILGRPPGRGEPLQGGSTLYTWDPIGLWLIADDRTGQIVWISVQMGRSNPWGELATPEGLRLGSTEEEVLAVMGAPTRTAADSAAKSLDYDPRGIRFTLLIKGPMAGRIGALRVVESR